MSITNKIKYGTLGRPLEMKKTRDFCVSKNPKLTLVLIHGIASNSSTYVNTLKYLEGTTSLKDVRFVTFDLLGAGKSYTSDALNYDLKDQLEALHNSILKLRLKTPLVLLGHSLGSLIALNYADTYKKSVHHLILVSPPLYTETDLAHPALKEGVKAFESVVTAKDKNAAAQKQFKNSMNYIVLTKKNFDVASKLATKTTIIYGELDQFIAPYNIAAVQKLNPKHLSVVKTIGHHHMSRDKYHKLVPILEEDLNEAI